MNFQTLPDIDSEAREMIADLTVAAVSVGATDGHNVKQYFASTKQPLPCSGYKYVIYVRFRFPDLSKMKCLL